MKIDGQIHFFIAKKCKKITKGSKCAEAVVTTSPATTLPETTLPETTPPVTTPPVTTPPATTLPETTPPATTPPATTPPATRPPATTPPATTLPTTTPAETTVAQTGDCTANTDGTCGTPIALQSYAFVNFEGDSLTNQEVSNDPRLSVMDHITPSYYVAAGNGISSFATPKSQAVIVGVVECGRIYATPANQELGVPLNTERPS